MAAWRVIYAGWAETAMRGLPAQRRREIDTAMRATIGRDPYGHGSTAPKRGEPDYREAAVAGAIVTYYVSAPAVMTVTAVRLISA
ncbi:hypothetical protein [Streptomyces sp. NPDC049879]|uniref:hypothetical protein n=1 Tax=Streptomyces sp. NPDC049879 TaxID=3365598 RepID=UPI0037918185